MDNNHNNKKHTIVTLSPDITGKGNEGDTKHKKCKTEDCNAHESLNDESAAGDEETKGNKWDDVSQHRNTLIAIKNCTGTCKYFEPTKSQICLVLLKGLSVDLAYVTAGDHKKPCANCNGQISPCFYKDAIDILTTAARNHLQKYPYLTNANVRKFMYDKYFDKEYTYLHKLTGKGKLPHIPLPWCFETAVKKHFLTRPTKDSSGILKITNDQNNIIIRIFMSIFISISISL